MTVKLAHDAELAGNTASASWASATSTLTIGINSGVTTAKTVWEKINEGTATHGLTAESAEADDDDSGLINTAPVTTSGGVDAQPVTWTITLPGDDNDILLKGEIGQTYTSLDMLFIDAYRMTFKIAGDTIEVLTLETGPTAIVHTLTLEAVAGPSAVGSYEASTGTLTVEIDTDGSTTTADVSSAINAMADFSASGGGTHRNFEWLRR